MIIPDPAAGRAVSRCEEKQGRRPRGFQWSAVARPLKRVAVLGLLSLLTGCASKVSEGERESGGHVRFPLTLSAEPPDESSVEAQQEAAPAPQADPWERWNRKVYAFNDAVDVAVIKPVARAYVNIVPQPVRTGVTNFYGNFADAWSSVNNVLQGKWVAGLQDLMRVSTNTFFGLAGLFDVASEVGLDRHNEDLGQTLGHWGVGAGPYLVWPFLGPSTVRDSFALPLDRAASPSLAVCCDLARAGWAGLGLINERANLLPTTRMLDDMALDKYSFVRDAFLQRRRSLVYDGNEPPQEEPESAVSEPVPAVSPSPPAVASGGSSFP